MNSVSAAFQHRFSKIPLKAENELKDRLELVLNAKRKLKRYLSC